MFFSLSGPRSFLSSTALPLGPLSIAEYSLCTRHADTRSLPSWNFWSSDEVEISKWGSLLLHSVINVQLALRVLLRRDLFEIIPWVAESKRYLSCGLKDERRPVVLWEWGAFGGEVGVCSEALRVQLQCPSDGPGFRLLSHAVGPAWTLFPSCSTQCLYWSLALKICQWFPHYTKEQNEIQALLPFCINKILSPSVFCIHPLPPSSSPSCLGSSLFSNSWCRAVEFLYFT